MEECNSQTKLAIQHFFGTVWFNPESLANIVSLAQVRKLWRVTMDTQDEVSMRIHLEGNKVMKFKEHTNGLFYHDVRSGLEDEVESKMISTSDEITNYSLLQTVESNKLMFTRRQVQSADGARKLHIRLGRPAKKIFEHIIAKGLINNCPYTLDDVKRIEIVYGKDLVTLKGHMTKKKGAVLLHIQPIGLPEYILKYHMNVCISVDVLYIQGYPFIHTYCRQQTKFRTITLIPNKSAAILLKELRVVINIYQQRGFIIDAINADNDFAPLEEELRPIKLHLVSRDDHVGDVERSIRTVKEDIRTLIHGLPFTKLPKLMIVELVGQAIRNLNQFPIKDGISNTLSPLTLMTGAPKPDFNKIKLEFGQYVQVFEDNDPSNTTKSRSTGAITFMPVGVNQDNYYFMSLTTGKRLNRNQWNELPMPQGAIHRVHEIATKEGQNEIEGKSLNFEWDPGHPILFGNSNIYNTEHVCEEDEDTEEGLDIESVNNIANELDEDDGTVLNELPHDDVVDPLPANDFQPEVIENQGAQADVPAPLPPQIEQMNEPVNEIDNELLDDNANTNNDEPDQHQQNDEYIQEEQEQQQDEEILPRDRSNARYNLRSAPTPSVKAKDGGFTFVHVKGLNEESGRETLVEAQREITQFMFAQFTADKAIKRFGKLAVDALIKEFCQLENLKVFKPVFAHDLTFEQRTKALRSINLVEQKRTGKIKGRSVADGSTMKDWYPKEETTSPTVTTEALKVSLVIDALEERQVAISDVPGALLQADMNDIVHIKVTGEMVNIMIKLNPSYEKYVTIEKGRQVLYLQLLKALYGCVQSAML